MSRSPPCLGWDGACFRLGWGGGYFDRTLAALVPRPLTNRHRTFCRAPADDLPANPHDIPLDLILSEDGVAATSAEAGTDR